MIRVLFLSHIAQSSGGEIALGRLVDALDASAVEAYVLFGENGPLVEQLRSTGAIVDVTYIDPSLRDLRKDSVRGPLVLIQQGSAIVRQVVEVRRHVRANGIDVVHSNSLKSGIYGGIAARLSGVPLIWHLRDRLAVDYLPAFAVHLVRLCIALLATRVVCNSQTTLDTLVGSTLSPLSKRMRAIASSLPDVFDADVVRIRQKSDEGDVALRFVMVGRLAPWKGQHVALAAFEKADIADATLTFIGSAMFGEDHYAAALTERVESSALATRIRLLGFQKDVLSTLYQYDVLVHASVVPEPFGQVVVEGMAVGLAVVAARAGGPTEIITDGMDGLLHVPGDVDDLARQLLRVSNDTELRTQIMENGRLRASDYSPQAVALQMLDVYQACFRQKAPRTRTRVLRRCAGRSRGRGA